MSDLKKNIPVYSIDRFSRQAGTGIQFQIEIFDQNRDFKVSYPHRHDDFYEILFITQGKGLYTIDQQQYTISPNTVFFLSPGQIHEIAVSPDIKGYIFLFTSSFYLFNKPDQHQLLELPFFYNLAGEAPPLQLKKKTEQEEISDLFSKAVEEAKTESEDQQELIRALLDIILIRCKRLYPLKQEEKAGKGRLLVKRFKQLVEEKCQENLAVKDYAELLSVTPNHLSEIVKDITGRTSTDLINDRMLLEIKRMLIHTDLTVQEIAYALHFADQSYFSKYFKKLSGDTPQGFRQSQINKTNKNN